MFRAGRAAPRVLPTRWLWPMVAAGLALIALGEAAWLVVGSEPRVVERLVVIREPTPPSIEPGSSRLGGGEELAPVVILHRSSPDRGGDLDAELTWMSDASYVRLRDRVLRFGVEVLPEQPPLAMTSAREDPVYSRRQLRSEIEKLLNPGESS